MSSWKIRQAVKALKNGKVIAYPTEAVYGLGCDPWNQEAVERLLAIKQRSWKKGLILVAANFNQLEEFIAPLDIETLRQLQSTWPGPTTWLLPASNYSPSYLTGLHDTIAVRVSAHQQTADLCRAFGGAIVSSSANRAHFHPAKTLRQVRWQLPQINVILSGYCSGSDRPTEIRDAQTGERLR